MKKKIKNASIDELGNGQGHIFYRIRNIGRYYLIGGDEYKPGTLIKFEEFPSKELEGRIEKLMEGIRKTGKPYTEDYNIESHIIKSMIEDLIPHLKYHQG